MVDDHNIAGHYRTRIPSVDFRIMLQFWLGCIIPTLVLAPASCPCYHHRRATYTGQGLADVRGRHDTVCYNGSGAIGTVYRPVVTTAVAS